MGEPNVVCMCARAHCMCGCSCQFGRWRLRRASHVTRDLLRCTLLAWAGGAMRQVIVVECIGCMRCSYLGRDISKERLLGRYTFADEVHGDIADNTCGVVGGCTFPAAVRQPIDIERGEFGAKVISAAAKSSCLARRAG